jgi:thiazole synthase
MWQLADQLLQSRVLLGTSNYPAFDILEQAIIAAKTQVLTVSLKKANPSERAGKSFWELLQKTGCHILPNTAGCRTSIEAIKLAHIAREIFGTSWIKLEITGDDHMLAPNPFELLKAAEVLIAQGFTVFPYCSADLVLCQKLYDVGCRILMPWGSPIGSGKGLLNQFYLQLLRERYSDVTLIVDAGIGSPLHAIEAMLLGFDGILINSAVAKAIDPVNMAKAFCLAVESGRLAYLAGIMPQANFAQASTFLPDTLFWASK